MPFINKSRFYTLNTFNNFNRTTRTVYSIGQGPASPSRPLPPPQSLQQTRMMSTPNIENTNISTAPGVELSSQQKTIVGSVLDLFAGRPSLEKLQLWSDDATFEDPITIAKGRKQYEPQWVKFLVSTLKTLH